MDNYEVLKTDVLVIGGGAAGVRAAIEANNQGLDTCLASKGPIAHSGLTPLAYPSLQASFGVSDARDNKDVHYDDIVKIGRYLCDEDLARVLADEIVERVYELEEYGVKFKKQEDGKFLQVHHPGQTYPRNLFLIKGGFGLINGLRRELKRRQDVKILEDFFISGLLSEQGEVAGAFGLNLKNGHFYAIEAKATILACGGYEELWGLTDTAPDSTGDGVFLGYAAGADVIDMEMALYYPVAFAWPESVRGVLLQYETILAKEKLDFRLVNNEDKQFLPEGPLPVRDILMRSMFTEVEEGRGTEHNAVYIDPSLSSKSSQEIEKVIELLLKVPDRNLKSLGIDMRTERSEVSPAVHYTLGGVHINARAETTLPGLFAAGENASNIHGANRISGNALAETQVFGRRAGFYASEYAKKKAHASFSAGVIDAELQKWHEFGVAKPDAIRPFEIRKEMKQAMDLYMGPNRSEKGMTKALNTIVDLKENALPKVKVTTGGIFNTEWRTAMEVAITLDLAELTIRSGLFRKETRGHHFRPDYPETSETPQHTLVAKKDQNIVVTHKPVRRLK